MILEADYISRDLAVAILTRYGSVRRFHRQCLKGKLSYRLLLLAMEGGPRPVDQVRAIEAVSQDLLVIEPVRGLVPDPPAALQLAARNLLTAAEAVLREVSFGSLSQLNTRVEELRPLCST